MTQTHTVATDALATIGNLIDETAGRDAIHLAVEPAVAGERLHPADHVGRDQDGRWTRRKRPDALGIVDPFLDAIVQEGQRFWLVVYPRTITSLRHVWEHPAFGADAPSVVAETAEPTDKAASINYVREFVREHYGEPDSEVDSDYGQKGTYYDLFLSNAEDAITYRNDWLMLPLGQDGHGLIPDAETLFRHVGVILGKDGGHAPEYFSCSC